MDFFPSPSEVTYKIQGGLRHVEFGAQLPCFNFYEIIIYQLLAKLDESTPTVLTTNSPEFPMESPDILWQNLGPMTLISPPT